MKSLATSIATALAASFLSQSAVAGEATPPADRLGTVVVTASRAPVPLDETLAAVTVLTREDIERSQAPDLLTLLARQPGVDVARTGGTGQASTLFLRGTNSGHTLVLVDGVRVNPATQGAPDFAHFPLIQIERIEIVRGPRAALWGSDAIGGVIQLFTRDPSRAFFELHAGSYGRAGIAGGAGASGERGQFGLAVGLDRLRGFSATNPDYPFGDFPDDDGYRNRNVALRAGTSLGSQKLSGSLLASNARVDFDEGVTAARNRVYAVHLEGPLGAGWSHGLVLGRSSEDLDTPVYDSTFGSARTTLDWTASRQVGPGQSLDLGLNLAREHGYSFELFTGGFVHDRHNSALFAAWRGRFGRQSWEASLRHDDNSQFHGASTGSLAWGLQASTRLRLRASAGQGFRAPSFNELYYPGFFGFYAGNPALQPERSRSLEAGLDWIPGAHSRMGLSLFRTRVDRLIAFEGPVDNHAVNIDRAAINGAELDFHTERGRLAVTGNASWLDARDASTGEALLRRAPRKAALSVDWNFRNGARAGIDLSASAARSDVGGVRLGGYGRVDLRAMAPLAGGWRVEARLENLGDREYALVQGYNTAGRSVLFSLSRDAE